MTSLLTWLSSDVRPTYSKNIGGSSLSKGNPGEAAAFEEVERLVLAKEGVRVSNVKDFQINFRAQVATYTDPSTGALKEVDLRGIQDQRVQAALKHYYKVSGAEKWHADAGVIANSKGDQYGPTALQRKTDALKNLPTEIDYKHNVAPSLLRQPSEEARNVLSRRFLFVEFFRDKWKQKIVEKIRKREAELKNPTLPDAQVVKLKKELSDLSKLYEELKNIDIHALARALEHFPLHQPNKMTLDQAAEALKNQILEDIKPTKWAGLKKASHSQAEIEYAKDVAGLLYVNRGAYYSYCEKQDIRRKREGATDVFFREAIRFAVTRTSGTKDYIDGFMEDYTAEGFKESILLHEMSEELKKEVQDDLNGVGMLASHAIKNYATKNIDLKKYETAALPANATEQEKRVHATAQLQKMREAVTKHEEGIDDQLSVTDIPARPSPPPEPLVPYVVNNLVGNRNRAVAVATGVALTTLAVYARAVHPQVVNYVQHSLPYVEILLGGSLAYRLVDALVDNVCPKERDPNGYEKRRVKGRRMVIALSGAIGATMLGWMMYNAAYGGTTNGGYLGQGGELMSSTAQAVSLIADCAWENCPVQLPVSLRAPLTNVTWSGKIPFMGLLFLGNLVLSRIPGLGGMTKPVRGALNDVAQVAMVSNGTQWVYGKGKEYAQWGWNNIAAPIFQFAADKVSTYSASWFPAFSDIQLSLA